jgi:hypothetical protein
MPFNNLITDRHTKSGLYSRTGKLVPSLESYRSPGALRRQLIKPPSLHHTGQSSSRQLSKRRRLCVCKKWTGQGSWMQWSRNFLVTLYAPRRTSYTQISMVSHRGNVHGIAERHMKQSSLPTTVLICSAGICCVCPFFNSFILQGISIDGSSRDRRSWSIAQKPPSRSC